jgi:uncharacterized membrane protein
VDRSHADSAPAARLFTRAYQRHRALKPDTHAPHEKVTAMVATYRPARALAGFLTVAGTMHFVTPRFYDAMVPPQLPGRPRSWTYGSGIAEIGVAAAVAVPRTRRLGGSAAALLFVAVFPGNVQMAIDAHRRNRPARERLALLFRLPVQLPLVLWALKVRRGSSR